MIKSKVTRRQLIDSLKDCMSTHIDDPHFAQKLKLHSAIFNRYVRECHLTPSEARRVILFYTALHM